MQPARKYEAETPPSKRNSERIANANIIAGSLWMVAISLALFFLPAVNGLIGGLVGGFKVGSPRNALIAAILPALVIGAGLVFLLNVLGFPVLGFFAGAAVGSLVALSEVGLILGALLGGWFRSRQRA